MRRGVFALALGAVLLCAAPGHGWDFAIKDHEFTLDLTNTFGYTYFFNNDHQQYHPDNPKHQRDRLGRLEDDRFHQFFNKLDLSLSYGQFRAGARLDLHLFADTPFDQHCRGAKKADWCNREDHRYRNQFAAERLFLMVTRPEFDLTLGDFYAAFGKGLALSLIQLDEVGQDTTVRGGKLDIHHGDLGLTLLGGQTNTLDLDKATGYDAPWKAEPVVGARVEYNVLGRALLGAHAVVFLREDQKANTEYRHDTVWGVGLDLPDLFDGALSLSGEVDLQRTVDEGTVTRGPDSEDAGDGPFDEKAKAGVGAYAAATLQLWDVTVLTEFKYYDGFELIGFDKNPYVQMYHLPPTLDRKKALIKEGNDDVTGVRVRLDYNVGQLGPVELLLYANYGFFYSWRDDKDRRVHSPFGGLELQWGDATGQLQVGAGTRRIQDHDADWLYHEDIHVELSVEQAFGGRHGVGLKALLLDRATRPEQDLITWRELELTLSYKWSPHVIVSLTYERQEDPLVVPKRYDTPTDPDSTFDYLPLDLFSASVRYFPHFLPGSYVNLRVGESRGGIKCLNGVCREMPAFAGMELLLVVRH